MAETSSQYSVPGNMPLFYVPSEKKDQKQWCRQMLDYISGSYVIGYNKPRRDLYQKYFDMVKGVFNPNDYKYVWATWGDVKPMTFTNYPLLYPIISYINGEFMKLPLQMSVYKVNANAAEERLNLEAELLFLQLAAPYWAKMEEQMGMKLPLDQRMDVLPDNVKEYMRYDYRDLQERVVSDGLQYINVKHDCKTTFSQMLSDLLITGDCWGKIEYVDGDPVPRRIDPRAAIPDRGVDDYGSFKVMDSNMDYFFEEYYLTHSEVLYKYGHYMSDADKEKLKQNVQDYMKYGDMRMWNTSWCKYYINNKEGFRIRVIDGQWKARNQRDFPKEFNEATGEPETQSLDVFDVWEGVRIGHDIYCKLQRKKNILRTGDNYRQAQLDYFGVTSHFGVYDKGYALQMLYNIVMSHIEFAINQAGGKAVTIYLDDIPVGDDGKPTYDIEDIIYMAKVQGVILKQRKEGVPPTGYPDNYQSVDFGLSATINNLILFKQMIEQTASRMIGVSPDSLGFTSPYQAVGVTERNLSQTSSVLQPLYYAHSKMIELAFQKMADLMKVVWAKKETRSYVLGDMGMKTIQLDDSLSLSDYGVFVLNTAMDAEKKQNFLQMIGQTISVDPSYILEYIKVMNANSAVEAEKIVESAVDNMRKLSEQKQQQDAELAANSQKMQQEIFAMKERMSQYAADAGIKGKEVIAESTVKGKLIDKESAENVQEMKNQGALDQEMLRSANAPPAEKGNSKPKK